MENRDVKRIRYADELRQFDYHSLVSIAAYYKLMAEELAELTKIAPVFIAPTAKLPYVAMTADELRGYQEYTLRSLQNPSHVPWLTPEQWLCRSQKTS